MKTIRKISTNLSRRNGELITRLLAHRKGFDPHPPRDGREYIDPREGVTLTEVVNRTLDRYDWVMRLSTPVWPMESWEAVCNAFNSHAHVDAQRVDWMAGCVADDLGIEDADHPTIQSILQLGFAEKLAVMEVVEEIWLNDGARASLTAILSARMGRPASCVYDPPDWRASFEEWSVDAGGELIRITHPMGYVIDGHFKSDAFWRRTGWVRSGDPVANHFLNSVYPADDLIRYLLDAKVLTNSAGEGPSAAD